MRYRNEIIILSIGVIVFLIGNGILLPIRNNRVLSYLFTVGYIITAIGYIKLGYKLKNKKDILSAILIGTGCMGLFLGIFIFIIQIIFY